MISAERGTKKGLFKSKIKMSDSKEKINDKEGQRLLVEVE